LGLNLELDRIRLSAYLTFTRTSGVEKIVLESENFTYGYQKRKFQGCL
jgi:hypothetical protein